MPSWDSDPFSYLRRRALGQIGGFDPLAGAGQSQPPANSLTLNGQPITLNSQPITKAS